VAGVSSPRNLGNDSHENISKSRRAEESVPGAASFAHLIHAKGAGFLLRIYEEHI
jgi:hypothetical protein